MESVKTWNIQNQQHFDDFKQSLASYKNRDELKPTYYFRGQRRDYGPIIPSIHSVPGQNQHKPLSSNDLQIVRKQAAQLWLQINRIANAMKGNVPPDQFA